MHLLAVITVGALLSASPFSASASSVSMAGGASADPTPSKVNKVVASDCIHAEHQAILEAYFREVQRVTSKAKAESDLQRKSTEAACDRIQASAASVKQQSPQETGARSSVALQRLKEEARDLKIQLPSQGRALRGQWDSVLKDLMTQASDALVKADVQYAGQVTQKAKDLKEVRTLLHKQHKETLKLLEGTWKDSASQIRNRIAQVIKGLDRAISVEQAKERGPVVGYKTVLHKGHLHRVAQYQNEQHRDN